VTTTAPVAASTTTNATRIARSAVLVMSLLAVSKGIGLTEKYVIIQRFGISSDWDTFTVANQVPEQLFNLIAGGALAYAFIPVFGAFLTRGDRNGAWQLAANVMNTIFLFTLAVAAVVFLAAPWLVTHVVAPGFDGDKAAQTAALMRILLAGLLIFSISGLSIGMLQAQQRFLLPALAPILYDLGILFGAVFLKRFGVYGIAYGAVLGAALHLGVQVPGLVRSGFRWRPTLDLRDASLREVVILMIPRAAGLALANVNLLVAYRFASGLATGAPAAFNWGYALMQLPETLIGTAMGIVIFPTLSLLSAAGDLQGKRSAMGGALRFIFIATIPAAVAMLLAGRPLLGLLEGGAFAAEDADRVFRVLQFFALSLIVQSAVEIVARSFYADKDMITPLLAALGAAIINVIVSLALMPILDVAGLALANGIATSTEMVVLLVLLRRRWNGIEESALAASTLKALIAGAVMATVIVILELVLHNVGTTRLGGFVRGVVEIAIGVGVYLGTALLLRMDEVRELPRLILRRQAAEA